MPYEPLESDSTQYEPPAVLAVTPIEVPLIGCGSFPT
jgi:hypothetical protein